jgi:hypothetical protein
MLGLELTIDMSIAFTILLVLAINENVGFLIVIWLNVLAESSPLIGVLNALGSKKM